MKIRSIITEEKPSPARRYGHKPLPETTECENEYHRLDNELNSMDKVDTYLTTIESYMDFVSDNHLDNLPNASLYNLAIEELQSRLGEEESPPISLEAFNGLEDKTSSVSIALEQQTNALSNWLKKFWDWLIKLVEDVKTIQPIMLNSTAKLKSAYSDLLYKASQLNKHDPAVVNADRRYLTWSCASDAIAKYFYGCTTIFKGIENLDWFCKKVGGDEADVQYKLTEKYIDQTSKLYHKMAKNLIVKQGILGGYKEVQERYARLTPQQRASYAPMLSSINNTLTAMWTPTFTSATKRGIVAKIGIGTAAKAGISAAVGATATLGSSLAFGLGMTAAYQVGVMAFDAPYKNRIMAALYKLGTVDKEQHVLNAKSVKERALSTTGYEFAAIPRWRKDAIPNDMTFVVLKISPGKKGGSKEVGEDFLSFVRMERRFFSVNKVLGLGGDTEMSDKAISYFDGKMNPADCLERNIRTALWILEKWYPKSVEGLTRSSGLCTNKLKELRMSIGNKAINARDEKYILNCVRAQVSKLYIPMKQFHLYLIKSFKMAFKALHRVLNILTAIANGQNPEEQKEPPIIEGSDDDHKGD